MRQAGDTVRRGSARRLIWWLLAALALSGILAAVMLLAPSRVGIVANCLSQLVNRVDPEAILWQLDSSAIPELSEADKTRLSIELAKDGITVTEEPIEHRLVLFRAYRANMNEYIVVAGAYAPPWGGQEIEFTASLVKGWRIVRRTTLRQS